MGQPSYMSWWLQVEITHSSPGSRPPSTAVTTCLSLLCTNGFSLQLFHQAPVMWWALYCTGQIRQGPTYPLRSSQTSPPHSGNRQSSFFLLQTQYPLLVLCETCWGPRCVLNPWHSLSGFMVASTTSLRRGPPATKHSWVCQGRCGHL